MNVEPKADEATGQEVRIGGEILQFATFYLNGEMLGLNILKVQEIQQPQLITPVPLAPDHIMGLISLRGHIVTLIDLRKRLGMDISKPIKHPYHIVVNTQNTIACFEVDEIGDVVDVPVEEFVPPPESVRAIDARFLEGVYPLENRILAILNVDVVLENS